jgi:hypothetical protein
LLLEAPWLAKCPHCFKLFWSDDAEEIGEIELAERAKKWPNAWEVYLPSEADYYAVLDAGLKDREKEKYCRIRAWWYVNEGMRYSGGRYESKFSQEAIRNLEILYELLRMDQEDERIIKAEIARELGRFEEAISILNYPFKKELQKTAALIKTLAEQKNIVVQEIK